MDIGKTISRAVDLYFKNFVVLFVAMLLVSIVGGVTLGVLVGPLLVGMIALCLKVQRGQAAEIGEAFAHFDKFAPALLIFILAAAAFGVTWIISWFPLLGWIFALFAYPLVWAVLILSLCAVVDKNLDLGASLKEAVERIKAKPVEILVLALIFGLLSGICAILSAPIGVLGLTLIYLEGSGATIRPDTVV